MHATSVVAELLQTAQTRARDQAIFHSDSQPNWVSWGGVVQWVASACEQLSDSGLRRGEHVASVAVNSAQWLVFDFACQLLGLVHVAIDPRWSHPVIESLLLQSDSQRVYAYSGGSGAEERFRSSTTEHLDWQLPANPVAASETQLAQLVALSHFLQGDAPAQILFTSGTTGTPKAVVLSHYNLLSNARAKLDAAPQCETDLRLNILPFCHAYARTCELSTWVLSGSRLAIASDWNQFLRMAQNLQPTLINLVPHLVRKVAMENCDGESTKDYGPKMGEVLGGRVRLLQVGGAALSDALWQKFADAGLPPLQGYGLTEASPVICSNRAGEQRPGSIGPAVQGVELRVDERKQLWVRGPNVMLGYYGDEASTQMRIQHGWLATGDLVEQDTAGLYRIVGRLSEVIVLSTGFKVSPEILESRIATIEWLERVLVVGEAESCLSLLVWPAWERVPDEFFQPDRSAFTTALQQRVEKALGDLPAFMHPRKLIIVERPATDSSLLNAKGAFRRQIALQWFAPEIERVTTLAPAPRKATSASP